MIQKTPAEKAAIKAAKIAYKKNQQHKVFTDLKVAEKAEHPVYILTGIMEDEDVLPDDYPVYWDYLYVIEDNGGMVVRSDINGTIPQLRADLQRRGLIAVNIRRCNLTARNIF